MAGQRRLNHDRRGFTIAQLANHNHVGVLTQGAPQRFAKGVAVLSNLSLRDVPPAGVAAASGGNHGAAVADAAARRGLPATIFVPTDMINRSPTIETSPCPPGHTTELTRDGIPSCCSR